jgi:hypothetical protein
MSVHRLFSQKKLKFLLAIDLHVEELCIGIPFLYVSYPSALFFASPFDDRKAHNLPFEHAT